MTPEGCIEFNDQVMDWLATNDSVRYVVISSRYAYYLDKDYYLVQDGEVIPVNRGLTLSQLNATLDAVRNWGKPRLSSSRCLPMGGTLGIVSSKKHIISGL